MSNTQTWVGRFPGHDGLIRIKVSGNATDTTFDIPNKMTFSNPLQREVSLSHKSFSSRIGEYTDGDITLVITMASEDSANEPFAFYADLDHDAIVRLYAIADNKLLSEQGEQLHFTEDGDLILSVDDCQATLKAAPQLVEEEVSFLVSGSATVLSGTLLRPDTSKLVPAVVLAHGSTFNQRDFYRIFAHSLTRAGLAVLIYDREGYAASTGSQQTSLQSNAAGIEAALDFLNNQEGISQVGLWGISNGMWTVPLVAARRPDVAFVAGVSAPGVTMIEAELHRRVTALQAGGVSDDACEKARQAWQILWEGDRCGRIDDKQHKQLDTLLTFLKSDESVASFAGSENAAAAPGLSPLPPLGPTAQVVADHTGAANSEISYDPINSYREINCPILLQYGEKDGNIPAQISAERIGEALREAGNNAVTITSYDDAGHLLERIPEHLNGLGYEQAVHQLHGFRFASGAVGELVSWAHERCGS